MGDLLRFETAHGPVLVEERGGVDLERVGLLDRIRPAKQRLETALGQIKPVAETAIAAIRELAVSPQSIELELGLTLTAEAGAVVSRTALEGHLVVRVTWHPQGTVSAPAAGDNATAAGEGESWHALESR